MPPTPEAPAGLFQRIGRRYRQAGWRGLWLAGQGRYRRWAQATPVGWARFGRASLLLAESLKPRQPPVLVLSLGRSGSTWVAEMLGEAADALYLNEPINLSLLGRVASHSQIEHVPAEPPRLFYHYADLAFAACPAFSYPILRAPARWGLAQRRRRRLVIKEVNPLACRWLLERYRPRVIFLVRHPAAVALSYRKMSWWSDEPEAWRVHAFRQARALDSAWNSLQGYLDCRTVTYEAMCLAPHERFRALFEFAGLEWSEKVEQLVGQRSASGDLQDPWATSRDSRRMVDAWRAQVAPAELEQVRRGYFEFDLPWYRSDADW